MHLRAIELHNTTGAEWVLMIEPAADQHLGAATTFTGRLRPGERKILYLYHGFRYRIRVAHGREQVQEDGVYEVDRDLALVFTGDSLSERASVTVELGPPTTIFADSIQEIDPFGLRRSLPDLLPDSTGVRRPSGPEGPASRRGAEGELP